MILDKKYCCLLIITQFVFFACKQHEKDTSHNLEQSKNTLAYVDPFIGTGGHGHTYPGATVPFGMIQLSPDNGTSGWDWSSGYHFSDSIIAGFSHLHLSGTGIGDLSDILFTPATKSLDLANIPKENKLKPYVSSFSHLNEKATPGLYSVYLEDSKVTVGLTATERVGFQKYDYKEAKVKSVVLDLAFAVNWDTPINTSIKVEDSVTISGYRHSKGWAKNQKVFFVSKFSAPIKDAKLYTKQELVENSMVDGISAAQFFFDTTLDTLEVKTAISSVSVANAKLNLESAANVTFEEAQKTAQKEWEKALSKIQVTTAVDSLKTIFYSALYHSQVAPVLFSDSNGQFRFSNDSIGSAKNFKVYSTLSLWDTFRAEQPLLTLVNPTVVSDIINSMLVYYKQSGSLPVWTLYGNETDTMTGYHSIPVIVEAYFKGIQGFDAELAFEAMKQTMMQDKRGLKYLKEVGYVPFDKVDENVTYTLEYAYNDWCVAQLAKALKKEADYQYFIERSNAYKMVFDAETRFMRGRSYDGGQFRTPFDPKYSKHMENTDYTEGNAWQHSWFVPHDVNGLIELHGGKTSFSEMLEQLFTESSEITGEEASNDITGLIGQYAHGNEPSHHIAYLFNKAGKPWKTQFWVDSILQTQYNTTPNGLSGNEDAGQMSAWYVLSAMGIYPMNPASATYEIGRPLFAKSEIKLPGGNTFSIVAEQVSKENKYIQSATLNGQPFNTTTLEHKTILAGGTLTLIMGPEPNYKWGLD